MAARSVFIFFSLLLMMPATASAFCGFYVGSGDAKLYNDATQVVMMRDGTNTVLTMQNNFEGPTADFAMVVPVPEILQKKDVKTLKKSIFDRIDTLSAPRLVEYWEQDPCGADLMYGIGGFGMRGSGGGGGGGMLGNLGGEGGGYVKVEAQFEVGEYDISILKTNDAATLDKWLRSNQYKIPDGAEPYFKPYIDDGMYFFVAKVIASKVTYKDGRAVLSPLRFHYQSDDFELPIRLGMINSKGKQDLMVYILAQSQRYDVANYPNVFIPTNVEVNPKVKSGFGDFYEALFSRTSEENPRAVVTEYAWSATKCDPCPTGSIGGATLQAADFSALGADVLMLEGWQTQSNWVLTRLHARYAQDDIGEDLIFRKAKAVVGGREVKGKDGIESGAVETTGPSQFQGRYIVRNEWEGEVACDNPRHGRWGRPPNPTMMTAVSDTLRDELRRQRAAVDGKELTKEMSEAPLSDDERRIIGFHLRRRFGTSSAPASAPGPLGAPSGNTRGVSPIGLTLSALPPLVKRDVPEIGIVAAPIKDESKEPLPVVAVGPSKAGTKSPAEAGDSTAMKDAEKPATKPASCGTTPVGSPVFLLFGLFFLARKRRRP